MSATDACGKVGPHLTSVTLAFAPGELSTSVGIDMYTPGSVRSFDPADLPCGPTDWNSWLPDGGEYPETTYQPIIALPRKLLDLVPAWSDCAADSLDGQDPPRVLSPNSRMVPVQTSADQEAHTIDPAPSPPIPGLPRNTGATTSQIPIQGDTTQNVDPPSPVNSAVLDGPSESESHFVRVQSTSMASMNPDPGAFGARIHGTGEADATFTAVTPATSADTIDPPPSLLGLFAEKSPVGFGPNGVVITDGMAPKTIDGTAIAYQSGLVTVASNSQRLPESWPSIYNSPLEIEGFKFSPIVSLAPTDRLHSPAGAEGPSSDKINLNEDQGSLTKHFTIGDQVFTEGPDGIVVAGATLRPGSPGTVVDGTLISLGSSDLIVGSRVVDFRPQLTQLTQSPCLTLGSKEIVIGSSVAFVAGSTLRAGGSAIIVDGTKVSLGSSELFFGSFTTNIDGIGATATPESTISGSSAGVKASNGVVDAESTTSPGGTMMIIDGTMVSVGSSLPVTAGQTGNVSSPATPVTTEPGLGALILSGFGAIESESKAVPSQSLNLNNSTFSNGNSSAFSGRAVKLSLPMQSFLIRMIFVLLLSYAF